MEMDLITFTGLVLEYINSPYKTMQDIINTPLMGVIETMFNYYTERAENGTATAYNNNAGTVGESQSLNTMSVFKMYAAELAPYKRLRII